MNTCALFILTYFNCALQTSQYTFISLIRTFKQMSSYSCLNEIEQGKRFLFYFSLLSVVSFVLLINLCLIDSLGIPKFRSIGRSLRKAKGEEEEKNKLFLAFWQKAKTLQNN